MLGLVQEWSTNLVTPTYKDAIGFLVLILVLLFRPNGVFGHAHPHRLGAARGPAPRLRLLGYVLTVAGIYAVFVLGLQVQVGDTGLLNFGHVAFMAGGGLRHRPHGHQRRARCWSRSVWGCCWRPSPGVLLGIPTLRLRGDYFAIVTIAAGEILRITDRRTGRRTTGGTLGLRGAAARGATATVHVLDWLDGFGWSNFDRRVPLLVITWLVAVPW